MTNKMASGALSRSRCCPCMKNGRCIRCQCVKNNRKCVDCWPSSMHPTRCENKDTDSDYAGNSEEDSDSITRGSVLSDSSVPSANLKPNIEPISQPLDEWIARHHKSIRCLRRIPRASRHLVASKLSSILNSIVDKNDLHAWTALIDFPHRYLLVPARGGHRRSLASCINRRLGENGDSPLWHNPVKSTHIQQERQVGHT